MKLRFLFAFMLFATLAMSQDVFRFTTSSGNQARAYFDLAYIRPAGAGATVFTKDAVNGIATTTTFQSLIDSSCGELTVINDLRLGQIAIPNSGVGKIAPKTGGGCIITMYNNVTRTYEATQSFTSVVNSVRNMCGAGGGGGSTGPTIYNGNGDVSDQYRRVTMAENGVVSFWGGADSVVIREDGVVSATGNFLTTSPNFDTDNGFTQYDYLGVTNYNENADGSVINNIALKFPVQQEVSYDLILPNEAASVGDALRVASINPVQLEFSPLTPTANNGLNVDGGVVQMGGDLTEATSIGTSNTNTLSITGLPTSYTNSDPLVVNASGQLAKGVTIEEVVEFNTNNPNSGSPTFTPNTPALFNTLYVSTTNSTSWIWNGTAYVTAPVQTRTPFFLANTTTDAGNNKNAAIYRNGRIGINTNNPSTFLHVNTNSTNASGIRMEDLTSASPATTSTGYTAVSNNGTIVRATDPLLTEVDGSVSNEGSLTVGAGTATTSVINSNTSGSTPVTLLASSGLSISEAGNTITITNTGVLTAPNTLYTGNGSIPNYINRAVGLNDESSITFNSDVNNIGHVRIAEGLLQVKTTAIDRQVDIENGAINISDGNAANPFLNISRDIISVNDNAGNYTFIDNFNIATISTANDFIGSMDGANQEISVSNLANTQRTSVGLGGFKFGATTPTIITATPSTGETFTFPPSTPFEGFMTVDISGNMGVSQINELQNVAVAATAPTNGQVLTYNTAATQWEPQTPSGGGSLLGDEFIARSTHFNDYPFFISGSGAGWENTAWGTSGTSQQPALAGRTGISVVNLNSAAALSGTITSWGNGNAKSYFPTAGARARASVNVFTQAVGIDSAKMRIGFFSRTTNMNRGRNGAYFELGTDGTAAYSLYAVTCNTTNATYTSLPANMATLFTNWRAFEVKWATATTVEFYIDNVLVATHTTNVPDGVSDAAVNRMYPAIGFGRVGSNAVASANTVNIDYILFEIPTTRL